MTDTAETENLVRCNYCEKQSDIAKLPIENFAYLKLPNTLTGLDDIQNVTWKCPHCGCFQP